MELDILQRSVKDSIKAKEKFFTKKNSTEVIKGARLIVEAFNSGGKLLLCGNGGSAGDAQHIAAEFVNRFEIERPPLPALALTTDTSVLTSIGNDYHYDQSFSKQVRAIGREGDILLAISTSGTSPNVIKAVETAQSMNIKVIGLSGKEGGELARKADIILNVDHKVTARIQETHILIGHIICQLVDYELFQKP